MTTPPRRRPRAIPSIAADALRPGPDDPLPSVIDARPMAVYNGWRSAGARRGGHVPGAVALPVAWLRDLDAPGVHRLLEDKGVDVQQPIVVYGDSATDPRPLAALLRDTGSDVAILDGGWDAWSVDPRRGVERLPRHHRLVPVEWLDRALAGGPVEAAPRRRPLVFHVNSALPEEYEDGHVPGARYLDTTLLEDPRDWNRRSPAELDGALRALGITAHDTVVLYGRDVEGGAAERWPGRSGGQIAAARAALILSYAGVDDVRLLDGGYDRWVRAGRPLDTTVRHPEPVTAFGRAVPYRPAVIIDIGAARQILVERDGSVLASVRSRREQAGIESGYAYITPAGRIRGDAWGNSGPAASPASHYRNIDNTLRPYPEIQVGWAAAGITPAKRVAFYCGTGWRASEAWFAAFVMGWPRVAVYDGGWFEWSKDPLNNPVDVGEPPDPVAA